MTKVVRLPGTEGKPPITQVADADTMDTPLTKERAKSCQHRHIAVQTDRRVLCNDCQTHIDPVDYILKLAEQWDWYARTYKDARQEIRNLGERVSILRKDEVNVKGRLKRALRKATDAGVIDVEESREIRRRAGIAS